MISIIEREPTPNPNAFKFRTGTPLVGEGTLSFSTSQEAERLPLARRLVGLGYVDAVFIADDFVSVSASQDADWLTIEHTVADELAVYDIVEAASLATVLAETGQAERIPRQTDELFRKVDDLLNRYVRPALAADGGGVELVCMDGKIVHLRYQGACGSCPSATRNTLFAIERLLRSEIDPEIRVIPAL